MAQQTISIGTQQQAVFNSLVPPEGPKAVPQTLDFSASSSYLIDFTQAYDQKIISAVQTIWVDNSGNSSPVKFTVAGTNQSVTCPANAQGVFPIISAIRTKITASSSGNVAVPCQFLNVPLPVGVWHQSGSTAAGAAAFAIAAAATAVTAFDAASLTNGAVITNPPEASESLFIDLVNIAGASAPGAHGTTTELKAGQSFNVPGGLTNAVSVCAATAGHAFTAWRW